MPSSTTASQGVINGRITALIDQPEQLKEFMADKTDEQKRQARLHLKMVRYLRGKK